LKELPVVPYPCADGRCARRSALSTLLWYRQGGCSDEAIHCGRLT
jgi:hypothetical protein